MLRLCDFFKTISGFLLLMAALVTGDKALNAAEFREDPGKYWDFEKLSQAPKWREADFPESRSPGLQAILFEGVEVKGVKSQMFCYFGKPETPMPEGGYPAVILAHGAGGTAFAEAAKLWISYGYAVLAVDWYNQRPASKDGLTQIPLDGGRRQLHVENVANMVLAHSLLRRMPQVNPDKIAYVGLSWGSIYGAMLAAVDPRFKAVIELYCGDCNPQSEEFTNGRFLHAAQSMVYWIGSTNDPSGVSPESLQRAFVECPKTYNKTLIPALAHGHFGFRYRAIRRMVDHFLMGKASLPILSDNKISDGVISAEVINPGLGIKEVYLCYNVDNDKPYILREWKVVSAEFDGKTVSAKLPDGVFECFLAAYDEPRNMPEEEMPFELTPNSVLNRDDDNPLAGVIKKDRSFNHCCGTSDLVRF